MIPIETIKPRQRWHIKSLTEDTNFIVEVLDVSKSFEDRNIGVRVVQATSGAYQKGSGHNLGFSSNSHTYTLLEGQDKP